ncbi:MAG: hypothetical protein ACT4PL_04060 [Phycisphaerales bacterium]
MLKAACLFLLPALAFPLALAQPPATPSPPVVTKPAPEFPALWRGHWKGPSRQVLAGGSSTEFRMELIIGELKNGRAQWTIVYDGAAGRQERPYELVLRDDEKSRGKGRFAIDEKQGIEIEMTLLDGALYGLFFVKDAQISVSYRLLGTGTADERLEVEMVTTRTGDGRESGGKDEVPVVHSFPPVSVQKAVLKRG